jgi:predicted nucleic acid-binding protein
MIVVSDTSPLSNLAIVNHLWLLQEIYGLVIISEIVSNELKNASLPEIQNICHLEWIKIVSVQNVSLVHRLQNQNGLDLGEANAIALAIELQADDLLIDERLGRREALQLGLSIIGILGILLVAKKRGLIPQIKPIMNALINQAGFRVSDSLYQRVLSLSNEN